MRFGRTRRNHETRRTSHGLRLDASEDPQLFNSPLLFISLPGLPASVPLFLLQFFDLAGNLLQPLIHLLQKAQHLTHLSLAFPPKFLSQLACSNFSSCPHGPLPLSLSLVWRFLRPHLFFSPLLRLLRSSLLFTLVPEPLFFSGLLRSSFLFALLSEPLLFSRFLPPPCFPLTFFCFSTFSLVAFFLSFSFSFSWLLVRSALLALVLAFFLLLVFPLFLPLASYPLPSPSWPGREPPAAMLGAIRTRSSSSSHLTSCTASLVPNLPFFPCSPFPPNSFALALFRWSRPFDASHLPSDEFTLSVCTSSRSLVTTTCSCPAALSVSLRFPLASTADLNFHPINVLALLTIARPRDLPSDTLALDRRPKSLFHQCVGLAHNRRPRDLPSDIFAASVPCHASDELAIAFDFFQHPDHRLFAALFDHQIFDVDRFFLGLFLWSPRACGLLLFLLASLVLVLSSTFQSADDFNNCIFSQSGHLRPTHHPSTGDQVYLDPGTHLFFTCSSAS